LRDHGASRASGAGVHSKAAPEGRQQWGLSKIKRQFDDCRWAARGTAGKPAG
jgi:hypothetical protein